jgi:1-deoxy-D-xylulose-5-phosphate synthase
VAFAAGLAKAGLRPIVDIYSTFLQRSYDQIFQEVSLQNLPVTMLLDRSGIVGPDGPTHHGVFDMAYLRPMPNPSWPPATSDVAPCSTWPAPNPSASVSQAIQLTRPAPLLLGHREMLRPGRMIVAAATAPVCVRPTLRPGLKWA